MAEQIITLTSQQIFPLNPVGGLDTGETFTVVVDYDSANPVASLTGLGFRLHYDNTELEFVRIENSQFAQPVESAETTADGDADTNRQIAFSTNGTLPDFVNNLFTVTFRTKAAAGGVTAFDGSSLNVTFSSNATGYVGQADPLVLALADATAPAITAPTAPFTYVEGQVANYQIGQIVATDNVAVTTYAITPASNPNGFFAIDNTGKLTLTAAGVAAAAASNDFETGANQFDLAITATDAAANVSVQNFTINVTNKDEDKPVITAQAALANPDFDYNENRAAGYLIGTIAATDDDDDGDANTNDGTIASFAIKSVKADLDGDGAKDDTVPNGTTFFAIDATGKLTLTAAGAAAAVSNNFETVPHTNALPALPGLPGLDVAITAKDAADNESAEVIFTFDVKDIDETKPVVTAPAAPFGYEEGKANGFLIGVIAATDDFAAPDTAASSAVKTFTIVSGNENGYFAISNVAATFGQLTLTAAGAAATAPSNDFETAPNAFTLGIQATDGAGNVSDTRNFTINVTDKDDTAPIVTPNQTFSYFEDRLPGLIGTVIATDTVGVTGYTIVSGNPSGFFAISNVAATFGQLTLTAAGAAAGAASNDFETGDNNFILGITARDALGNVSAPVNVTIEVKNVDDDPVIDPVLNTTLPLVGGNWDYDENRVAGFQLGVVEADDDGQVVGYTIASVKNPSGSVIPNGTTYFAIDNTGKLTLTAAGAAATAPSNDFETAPNNFVLAITATDNTGNTSAPVDFRFEVQNTEDVAPIVNPAFLNYTENKSAGDPLGTVVATDNVAVTGYSIVTGNTNGYFTINNVGVITLTAAGAAAGAASNDFEISPNEFVLAVTARDAAGNVSTPVNVTLTVTNVEDTAPVVEPNQTFTYIENQAANYVVANKVAASDNTGVTGYAIVSGNPSGFFAIDNTGKLTLTAAGVASAANNFEATPNTFILGITARDAQGNTSAARDVTINVTDANDAPPAITPPTAPFQYAEGQAANYQIGVVQATDDGGTIVSYQIVTINGQAAGAEFDTVKTYFALDNTGKLTLTAAGAAAAAASNDFETGANTFALGITATDNQTPAQTSGAQVFTVNVTDVDEEDPAITPRATPFAYDESRVAGYEIGRIQATDGTGVASFAIASGNDAGFFAINLDPVTKEGVLTLTAAGAAATAAANDFETAPNTFTLGITATDAASVPNTSPAVNFTVNVRDLPTLTIAPTDAEAGEAGLNPGQFTFTLSQVTATALTVNYTVSGTARPNDYTQALNGTFTIPAGSSSATLPITAVDDSLVEGEEALEITINTGNGYELGVPGSAIVRIADNETVPAVTATIVASDATASEAARDPGQFTFTLSQASASPVTINYIVSGTAVAADYTDALPANGTITIPAGQTTRTIDVTPLADALVEPDQTIVITLDAGANYALGEPKVATVTITDNNFPTATIAATDAAAGEAGLDAGRFTITLSEVSLVPVIVNYTVTGTADTSDYTEILAGTATIAPGETTTTIVVTPVDDAFVEGSQTVIVTLGTGSGYILGGTGTNSTVTIADNDVAAITASIAPTDPTAAEAGLDAGEFTVTLSAVAPEGGITVSYTVAGTATAVGDYAALPGTVTIAAGETTATIAVTPVDDGDIEPGIEETVEVSIIPGVGYTLGATPQAAVTIADNDAVVIPTATIAATDNAASEQGDNPGEFTITLSAAPTADVVLTYTVAGTAATNGSDYTALDGTVTVLAGETTATIAVLPVEDAIVEGNESVIVTLTDGAAYDLGAATVATVTIADSVITDIDGNTDINDADIALVVDFLLGATPGELESTFNQYSSLTEGASNTTAEELAASIESQLSLFDIDGSGETTTADIFVINSYILFQDLFGGSRPAIESQLASLAEDLSLELTGPNTTGPGLYNTLSALFV